MTAPRIGRGRAVVALLALALAAQAPIAWCTPFDDLPVGDPLENELRLLDVAGIGRAGLALRHLHMRPLQIAELAGAAAGDSVDSPAARIARARLGRALARDLPDTLGLPSAGATPRMWTFVEPDDDQRFDVSLGLDGGGESRRGQQPRIVSGSGGRLRLGGSVERWSAYTDLLFGRLESARDFADPIIPGNDLVSHAEAAVLAYTGRRERWGFRIGRSRWHWGPGEEGSLLLSRTAPPITAVALRARLERLGVDAIALSATLDAAAGEQLAAHRIEVQPRDGLRLGLAEAARYHSAAWQPLYLAGVVPYVLVQRLQVQEEPDSFNALRNNVIVSADIAWRMRPGMRAYGEVVIDDLHARTADNPNKLGLQVGLEGVMSAHGGRLSGGAEFTRISRYVYTSFFGRSMLVQDQPLGWPYGPDSRRIQLRGAWDPGRDWQLIGRAAQLDHGEGRADIPYVPGSARPDVWAFEGVVERVRDLEAGARWWPRSGIDLGVTLGRRWITNLDHVSGVDRHGIFGTASVRFER
jgi:hypothetical protein